ncbi:Lipid-droplet associated hydrolase [Rhizoctonia solani]|uniref:Lipid-droplet associated hydrolase n=1 Tax=Rhizoctonia solani TaxID=456999 RepID=A0A8H7IGJ6_9AGAM|nr:Lipid-droplet associated hydrolase [Rhizoctonia solani]
MLSLPPFLQLHSNNTPRQGEAQDVKTHYPVVFSHKSQPGSVVGVADAEWWPPLVGDGRTPDALLLFIPGNPGLVEFYTEFLEHLHHTFNIARTHLAILVRGHIGHAPGLPTENGSWSVGLDSQVTSAIELYDSARDFYGPNTKIILAGHSVGSWIVAQVMHARPNTASGALLLFPTVSNIASTPNGQKLSVGVAIPSPYPNNRLSPFPPTFAPPILCCPLYATYISKFNEYPTDQLNVIKSLITSPHVVYSTLTMAHDEMRTIGSLGSASSTVQATCERERSRIYACFAAKDEWVGDEVSSVRAILDEQRVLVRDDDVPHAFCISHSIPVAETCVEWIKEILATQ